MNHGVDSADPHERATGARLHTLDDWKRATVDEFKRRQALAREAPATARGRSGACVYDDVLADDPHECATSATLPAGVPFSALARIAPGPGWRLVTTVVVPFQSGACVVAWWWERDMGAAVKA